MEKQGKLDDRETVSPNFLDFLGNPVSGYYKLFLWDMHQTKRAAWTGRHWATGIAAKFLTGKASNFAGVFR